MFQLKDWFKTCFFMKDLGDTTSKTNLKSKPIRVEFPCLELEYWSDPTLRTIAGTLDPMVQVDNITSKHETVMYARVLIEINCNGECLMRLFHQ